MNIFNVGFLGSTVLPTSFDLDELKVYWKFNESSGDVINQAATVGSTDSLGSGADLQITGATYNNANTPFNTMNFDGTNDDAVAGTSLSQFNFFQDGSKWSIAMWLEIDNVSAEDILFSNATGANTQACKLFQGSSGNFGAGVYDSGIWIDGSLGASGMVQGSPYLLVFTFDKDEATKKYTFYRNAVEISSLNQSTTQGTSANSAIAFRLFSQGGYYFMNANISEMSIWKRILTNAEITQLYNSGNGLEL